MVPRPWDFKLVPNILLVCGSVLAQLYTQDGRSWKLSALLLAVVLSQIVYEGILDRDACHADVRNTSPLGCPADFLASFCHVLEEPKGDTRWKHLYVDNSIIGT